LVLTPNPTPGGQRNHALKMGGTAPSCPENKNGRQGLTNSVLPMVSRRIGHHAGLVPPLCSLRKPAVYANFDPPRRSLPVGRQQSPIASAIAHPAMCSESAAKSLLLVEVGTPPRHESWASDRWTDEGTARAPVVLSLCCDVPAAASVATGPIAGKSAGVTS